MLGVGFLVVIAEYTQRDHIKHEHQDQQKPGKAIWTAVTKPSLRITVLLTDFGLSFTL
jgi:hypothetical protein